MDDQPRIVGNYAIGVTIGQGSFGKVKLCRHVKTGNAYAIKVIQKASVARDALEKVAREIRILRMLNHPHVVRTFDVFNTPRHIYIVMEYVPGGELFQYILVRQRVAEREAKKFFGQTILGIEYCHKAGIIHRDLKPENLLLDSNRNIKIIDFGLSVMNPVGEKLMMKCGSPHYSAPEMSTGKGYGYEVDVFSAGVILFALICGFLPFDNPDISSIPQDMILGDYHVPSFISTEAANLIHDMLHADPLKRIKLADIKRHVWLNEEHVTLTKHIHSSPVPPPVINNRPKVQPLPSNINDAIEKGVKKKEREHSSGSESSIDIQSSLAEMGLDSNSIVTEDDYAPVSTDPRRRKTAHTPSLAPIPEGRGVLPATLFAHKGEIRGAGDIATQSPAAYIEESSDDESLASDTMDHGEIMLPAAPVLVVSPSPSIDTDDDRTQRHQVFESSDEEDEEFEIPDQLLARFSSFQVGLQKLGKGEGSGSEVQTGDVVTEDDETEPFAQRHASFFTTARSSLDPTPKAEWWGKEEELDQSTVPSYQPGDARVFLSNYLSVPPEVIMARVEDVLDRTEIPYTQPTPWKWECKIVSPQMDDERPTVLRFTLEICKLTRLNVHVILYTRVHGSVWSHKSVAAKILNELAL